VEASSSPTSSLVTRRRALPSYLAIAAVASTARFLARLSLPRLERWLHAGSPPPTPQPDDVDAVADRVETLLSVSKPLLRHTCVSLGLTRYFFLRRAGADVQLVFGLSESDSTGHCWFVWDGEVYAEPIDPRERYLDMYTIPSG
jgi:hypothetical protein